MILNLGFPPTVNTYYRNITIAGRARTILSKKAKDYRESVASSVGHVVPLTGRLKIRVVLHAPTRRKYDIDNRLKGLLDSLQHAGVFADDEQVDRIAISRGEVRPRNGTAIIEIIELEAA